jgi:cell division protein FtsB
MDATVGIARRYKAETAALVDENAALRTENQALKEEVAELRKKAMLEAEK